MIDPTEGTLTDAVATKVVLARETRGEPYAEISRFFDAFAPDEPRWRRRNRGYHDLITAIHRALIPEGSSVLEIGSEGGHLLAALQPRHGVGIDVSPGMVAAARQRYSELTFEVASGEEYEGAAEFDYIVLSDVVPYVDDLLALFKNVARHSRPDTRVVIHSFSQLWRPIIRLAEFLRLKPRKPLRNWVSPRDVLNLLALADLEQVTTTRRILFPKRFPVLATFLNGFVANLPGLRHLCLTYWVVARPRPTPSGEELGVSVICPCRDEAGMIEAIVERVPEIGAGTELVFVEGGSTDGTREQILRQIERRPDRDITLVVQDRRGKGNAVRCGFERAKNDVLMILDADLTVAPEALPLFYDALADGHGEFVNGSRLVYGLDRGAMRFLNILGNKAFSLVFTWLLDQPVKDTLCGTKALRRQHYERIVAGRSYFGDFDPFGDFDLLLGAAKLNLKIVDLPVRYGARTYGQTKISRFRHGWLLLEMAAFAFWKLKVEILKPR
jgi:SAM-dependent methyltransferase